MTRTRRGCRRGAAGGRAGHVEGSVARAEQKQGAAGGLAVEGSASSAGVRRPPEPERTGRVRAISAQTESMVRMLRRWGWSSERPAELPVSGEDGAGEFPRLGLELVLGWRWFGCGCGELVQNRGFGGGLAGSLD